MTSQNTIDESDPSAGVDLLIADDGLYVCSLAAVHHMISRVGASHLVTLINQDTMIDTPTEIGADNHLRLAMNDIIDDRPGLVLPNETHITDLIQFTESWHQEAPMLIHCWAGISRSTAAAFISLCVLNPDKDENLIAQRLREASPTATPNRRLVEMADAALGRSGRMTAAVDSIGRGEMAIEGNVFGFRADLSE